MTPFVYFVVVDIVGIVNPAICLTNTSSLVMNINQQDLHITYWYECYHNSADRSKMEIFLKIKCKSCSISSKSGGMLCAVCGKRCKINKVLWGLHSPSLGSLGILFGFCSSYKPKTEFPNIKIHTDPSFCSTNFSLIRTECAKWQQ